MYVVKYLWGVEHVLRVTIEVPKNRLNYSIYFTLAGWCQPCSTQKMIGEVFLQAVPCPAALKLLKPFPVPGLEGSSASMPMYPGEAELSRQAQAIPCGVKGHHYSHPTNRDPCDHPQSWKSNSIFDLHLGPSDQPHPGLPAS